MYRTVHELERRKPSVVNGAPHCVNARLNAGRFVHVPPTDQPAFKPEPTPAFMRARRAAMEWDAESLEKRLLPASPASPTAPPAAARGRWRGGALVAAVVVAVVLVAFLETDEAPRVELVEALAGEPHGGAAGAVRGAGGGWAVVAACAGRKNALRVALPSWVAADGVAEVLVVDWGSAPPLAPVVEAALKGKQRAGVDVRVVRVDGEKEWCLTRAYNLAFNATVQDKILKVDCDYSVHPDILTEHPLRDGLPDYYAGYYVNSRDANEMHLNGAMVIRKRQFWAIGGFDERIQSYGYDDEDLYKRLDTRGFEKKNVSFDHITHIPHDDNARAQDGVKFPRVQIDYNKQLLNKLHRPWTASSRMSEYVRVDPENPASALVASYTPLSVQELSTEDVRAELWGLALGQRLRDDYEVPWGVILSMEPAMKELLLANMNRRKLDAHIDEVLDQGENTPRIFLIHVQNGLGNRIRVLGSSLAFASNTGREPVLIWESDKHLSGLFGDIFNASGVPFAVMNKFGPQWPLAPAAKFEAAWAKFNFYNYMVPEEKNTLMVDDKSKHIYYKAASVIKSPLTSWNEANEQILALPVRDDIQAIVHEVGVEAEDMVGVHIRNRSLSEDIADLDDYRKLYGDEDTAILEKWRSKTSYLNFVDEMRALLENGTTSKFFVATDTVAVLPKLRSLLPDGTVLSIARDCDDRSAHCIKYAMADLLTLAKTKMLLGSTWSSFTECAMRLGGPKARLAGTDFAV